MVKLISLSYGLAFLIFLTACGSTIQLNLIYKCDTEKCYTIGDSIQANELKNNPDLVDYESATYNFEKFGDVLKLSCSSICESEDYRVFANSNLQKGLNKFTGKTNYLISCLCGNLRE